MPGVIENSEFFSAVAGFSVMAFFNVVNITSVVLELVEGRVVLADKVGVVPVVPEVRGEAAEVVEVDVLVDDS